MAGDRYGASGGGVPSDAAPASRTSPAFTEVALVERYWERIRLFATRRLGDTSAADDVAQETIRRVVDALRAGRVNDLDALPGFVFQTARHICQQQARSATREARAFERLSSSTSEAGEQPDALAALISSERREEVRRALARLGDAERDLLCALYYAQAEPAELAARLGISDGALRVRKHRALKRLAELLGEAAS